MMMALGMFVFSLGTLAYTELQRQTSWRHPQTSRVGARSASQYLGPGDDTFTLTGVVLPSFGNREGLRTIHTMADTGQPYVLVDGLGTVYGQFVIIDKSEAGSLFDRFGQPMRTEFTITLRRVDDKLTLPSLALF